MAADKHPLKGDDDIVQMKFLETGRYADPDPSKRRPMVRARAGDILPVREAHARRLEEAGQAERSNSETNETRDDGSTDDLGSNAGAAGAHTVELSPDPAKTESKKASRTRRSSGDGE